MIFTDVIVKTQNFFSQFPLKTYKKGEVILQPEESLGSFFLKEGFVRQYVVSSQGIEVGIHIFTPNSFFPMTWVIADITNRYYFEVLTDARIFIAPKDKTIGFIKENPDVLYDLTKRAFMGLDKLTSRMESFTYSSAYVRVISIILYLVRHFGEKKDKKIYIKHKFTHREIGSFAGITRETTSREWEKLEKSGLITYENEVIVINDLKKLRDELTGIK